MPWHQDLSISNFKMRIAVLLSTFNGEKWLPELLESLENQQGPSFQLIYRDDGSDDSSGELVKKAKIDKTECKHFTNHLGSTKSYLHLLQHAKDHNFVAFCDQDDIWFVNKLNDSIKGISNLEIPAIVGSPVILTSTNQITPKRPYRPSTLNSKYENIIPGCTLVMNQRATRLALQHKVPEYIQHDHFLYFLIQRFGKVVYLNKPLLYYRVHDKNETGMRVRKINNPNFFMNFKLFLKYQKRTSVLADFERNLKNNFGQIFTEPNPIYRQKRFENLFVKTLVILRIIA
jgi:glycosyltransferase involved in cell wall biosynthesis